MPGTTTNAFPVRHVFTGFKLAALVAGDVLGEMVCPFDGQTRAVKVLAVTAGSGAVVTVIDLQKNGVSMYTTAANRPSLVATGTGEFANTSPDIKSVQKGDRLSFVVLTATTPQARVSCAAAIELA